ncbi:MAG: hypothetical protein KME32_20590 [Mojavia pulchra JT2-VF2]|jgi:gas vesicle protein|uniref:Uncharacterized protein n=1 Tax=Mojavia pulchra JT2-VF2 TaxID=287848 RepID=A0A951UHN2_9NOST|nr:hypothetical protein [Mojavia pulchra JT2-VF2]
MKRAISWLKNFRPAKILAVFLAGTFLILTQACTSKVTAQTPQPGAESPYLERHDPTKNYNLNEPQGGMNNFSDVDARAQAGEKAAEAKAKALRDNSKRNVDEKGIDSPGQYVENYRQGTPFGQRVKNLGGDIGGSTEELTEGVAKGTKRGIENIKENTQNAVQGVTKNAQQAAEDATDGVNKALK